MRTQPKRNAIILFVLPLLAAASALGAAAQDYAAIADVVAPDGKKLVTPIRIVITRQTSAEERAQLIAAVNSGGSASARSVLENAPDAGYIEIEDRRAILKYAASQPGEKETIVTVVTSQPLAFLGSRLPEAKPVAGFDLAIATLYVDDAGRGRGELSPAAKIKIVGGTLVTVQDYADKLVQLRFVERK